VPNIGPKRTRSNHDDDFTITVVVRVGQDRYGPERLVLFVPKSAVEVDGVRPKNPTGIVHGL